MRQAIARCVVEDKINEFDINPYDPPTIKSVKFGEIYCTLTTTRPVNIPPRALQPEHREQAVKQIWDMVKGGQQVIINNSAFNTVIIAIPKPLQKHQTKPSLRLVQDFRPINAVTQKLAMPMTTVAEAIQLAQGFEFACCSDAAAGFHQMLLDESIAHVFAFSVGPLKLLPLRVAMGGVNSMSAFCFAVSNAMAPLMIECGELDKRNKAIKELRNRYIADREANGDHEAARALGEEQLYSCLLYTSPSPRDLSTSRMPSSA